jgi:hypothetical protein
VAGWVRSGFQLVRIPRRGVRRRDAWSADWNQDESVAVVQDLGEPGRYIRARAASVP